MKRGTKRKGRKDLPRRIFEKGRWFYLVHAKGEKRIWTKVSLVRDGLPELYRRMAAMAQEECIGDTVPALIAQWMKEIGSQHSKKTQANDEYQTREISERLAEFRAVEITPPVVKQFLSAYRDRPRTHNAYRAVLRELMRYAEELGWRDAGSNPVTSIRTMSIKKRTRYITDSELRRIKVAAIYGDDGRRTRSGDMVCLTIDLAYLTGQRISDILDLRWSKALATDAKGEIEAGYMETFGIHFEPAKTSTTSSAKVLIEWTPRLRDLIERLRSTRGSGQIYVIGKRNGDRYTYSGFTSAWKRAVKRAKVHDCHFHDIRAKALTDKEGQEGMRAASTMGAHTTEQQTATYVRHKKAKKTRATR